MLAAAIPLALGSAASAQVAAALSQKAPEAAEIAAIAQNEGHVRVIVRFQPPLAASALTPDATTLSAVRAGVAATQDAIISSHFGSAGSSASGAGPARGISRFDLTPGFAVNVTGAELQALAADPRVTAINYDRPMPPVLLQSVPLVGMTNAYALGATGQGYAVAVLDTGTQSDHEFLSGKVIAEACFSNAGGGGGQVTLCPNGLSSQTGAGAAQPAGQCLNGGQNLCFHGTHVGGIAAGLNTNSASVVAGEPANGVAKNGGIFAIQVFTRFNAPASCAPSAAPCVLAFTSDQVLALDHVFANLTLAGGVKVAAVNMSLGGGPNTATACDGDAQKPSIDNLRSAGVLTAIAAGNNGSTTLISHPACISSALAIGSTTKTDTVSSFSNMAGLVHSLAPGGEFGACAPGANNSEILASIASSPLAPNTYDCLVGTSMATPHVAGAIAAIRSVCPNATANAVASALASTGTAVTDTRVGGTITKPRIRVDLATQNACAASGGLALTVAPATAMASAGNPGGPFAPASFQYQLSASSGTIGYSIGGLPSWLTASSTSGTLPTAPTTVTFTVNASANNLAAGTYGPAAISFTNTTTGQGNTSRNATLTVNGPAAAPVLVVSPGTDIGSSGQQGGPFSPSSFQYQLSTTTGTASYTISGLPSWLDASSTSGSLGTTPSTVTFTVNASANNLAPASYPATITFANATNGQGTTTRRATLTVDPRAQCEVASLLGDFTGDGRSDLLFRRASDGLIAQYVMNGFNIQGTNLIGPVGTEWLLETVADFNGDGTADLLFRRGDGTVSLYLMNGGNILSAHVLGVVGLEWEIAGAADFNGDGRADILLRRQSDGMLSLILMNGPQVVAAQSLGAVGPDWRVRGVRDVNGDGRADLVLRRGDGVISIYLFDGFQNIGAQGFGGIGPEWDLLGVRDFNGDRRADLLFRRASDGMLSLYLLNGFQVLGAQLLGAVGPDFTLVGLGDLNADGRSDMVFRRASDGMVAAFLMDGFQLLGSRALGAIGTDWNACYGQPAAARQTARLGLQ